MDKTPRMQQLEAMIAEDPHDPFLRYALAMEYASLGQDEECVRILRDLTGREGSPPYVPAYLQLGQALIRLQRYPEAEQALRAGMAAAQQTGDWHAYQEMQGFLESIS